MDSMTPCNGVITDGKGNVERPCHGRLTLKQEIQYTYARFQIHICPTCGKQAHDWIPNVWSE
jgi:hypothetical protein